MEKEAGQTSARLLRTLKLSATNWTSVVLVPTTPSQQVSAPQTLSPTA